MLARCQAVMADCTKALCQCPAVSLWLAMNINQLCVHAYVCVFLSCLSLSPLIHWNPMCVSLWMSVHITMFSSFRGSRVRRSEHARTPSHPQIIWDSRLHLKMKYDQNHLSNWERSVSSWSHIPQTMLLNFIFHDVQGLVLRKSADHMLFHHS